MATQEELDRTGHLRKQLKIIESQAKSASLTVCVDAYQDITIDLLVIEKAVIECRVIMLAYPKE